MTLWPPVDYPRGGPGSALPLHYVSIFHFPRFVLVTGGDLNSGAVHYSLCCPKNRCHHSKTTRIHSLYRAIRLSCTSTPRANV